MSRSSPGARTSRRRVEVNATTVLAVLLPLLTVAALLLVRPDDTATPAQAPTRTPLTSASVVCPSAMPGAGPAYLTTAQEHVRGEVTVGAGDESASARLASGRVTRLDRGAGPLSVRGEDDLAPGLLAARFGGRQLAATTCTAPVPDQWFTGVGAGARHTSVLELVNPDSGPAVADVTVYGRVGVIDVPRLRGVSVPGHGSVRLDLGQVVPRRDELAMHVVTSRGRLAASVLDRNQGLGTGGTSEDWLPAQTGPSTDNLLLGLASGKGGTHTLVLANAGADEVRAEVRIVSPRSVFAPKGVDEIRLPPESVTKVSLTEPVLAALTDGAAGVEVQSTGPITATLRSLSGGDLSHAVVGTPVHEGSTVLVPEGDKQVLLAGAESAGAVTVVARSATGERLVSTRAEVAPGRATVVKVPARATVVSVLPERTAISGAVVVSGKGTAVLALGELVRNGLVPAVRPGLP